MPASDVIILAVLMFAMAALYSSVGHAGASGYLAAMALVGVAPEVMRPTALVLNIIVATIAAVRFARVGAFSFPSFWPFALGSVPLAYIGGGIDVPGAVYKPLVALVLLLAAFQLVRSTMGGRGSRTEAVTAVPLGPAITAGGGIGLLSGLTGTGGGIFLSPLLLFTSWAGARESAGISAAFILVNSTSGLAGNLTSVQSLPSALPVWIVAAMAGGFLGTELGSRRFGSVALKRALACVLVIAAAKLVFT